MRNLLIRLPDDKLKICRKIGGIFNEAGERIFIVGGTVRDLCLDMTEGMDLDFTTTAGVDSIRRIMRRWAKAIYDKSSTKNYETQGVILTDGTEIEITPLRRLDGIPTPAAAGAATSSLHADLLARDFTINAAAIALAPDTFGDVTDPAGGFSDMQNRILRTPSPPLAILRDDPLRALRAIRFVIFFSLRFDPHTRQAILDLAKNEPERLLTLPGERVRLELFKILALPSPARAFRLMDELNILPLLLPELANLKEVSPEPGHHHKDLYEHTLAVLDRASELTHPSPSPPFLLAALLHDAGKPASRKLENGNYTFRDHEKSGADIAADVTRRLRLSADETRFIATIVLKHHRLHNYAPEWTDSAVRRALHDLGALYHDVLTLSRADATGQDAGRRLRREELLADFIRRINALEKEKILQPRLPINGNDVMQILGIQPGAGGGGVIVGAALRYIKDKVVSGELDSDDPESAKKMVANREWERGNK